MHNNKYVAITLSVILFLNQLRMTIHILILTSMFDAISHSTLVVCMYVACGMCCDRTLGEEVVAVISLLPGAQRSHWLSPRLARL